ncbi:MAG: hypothetical protein A2Y38_08095 [Spirochaetes bacterium GWB1_59_5]|nr:MAG: hypothetical protein A2Y38_08095 [Spirochaetes bacterium GWB1_59_5]
MAVKVRVRDYQSIHDAAIEIDGFTVVTGPNNSGKTALQRAVRGVFENTGGTAFVRHGTPKCSVDLEFSDGHSVSWEKGTTSKPAYRVDGGKPVYPGRQVPDEVKALGVRPIQAGGQEVWPNIAPQFTGQVFLIDKPGSVLAEAVADVERVGHLNRALRRVASDQNKAAADLRLRQEDRTKQEAHLAFYQGLDLIETLVATIERLEERALRLRKASDLLASFRERWRTATAAVALYQGVGQIELPTVGALDAAGLRIRELRELRDRQQQAQDRVQRFAGVAGISVPSEGAQPAETLLQELEATRGLRHRLEICVLAVTCYSRQTCLLQGVSSVPAESLLQERDQWNDLRQQRSQATAEVLAAEVGLRTGEVDVDEARREFDEALAEVGSCPLCGHAVEAE